MDFLVTPYKDVKKEFHFQSNFEGKTVYFYKKMEQQTEHDEEKFTASGGWLSRRKSHYNIRELTICEEMLSA